MESDISACESHTERDGSEALYSELVARYVVLDPSFKNGLSTNGKVKGTGLEFDYRPELRAIASKLKMYILTGESDGNSPLSLQERIKGFIDLGERIGKEEYHSAKEGFPFSYVSGPKYNAWISEINIVNERYLKEHPLYDSILTAFLQRNKDPATFDNMMGYLRALFFDKEFWMQNHKKENSMAFRGPKTINQLLIEDIERCAQFLENPNDEKVGIQLYVEITSRYDSIISGFGNGLYQYWAEQHFYDPEIHGEALIHNLNVIHNRMISYQAAKATTIESDPDQKGKIMSNKVFIVHGHDNEAKQEMARTLTKGGFDPIILHEQPDSGRTIIEKIERYSDVCYAVVLYTECDKGRDKNNPVEQERNRARQNVVFEHGYLIGKLGRDHVSALVKGDVETPGDISGVVYTPMDTGGAWKIQLANNMQDIGLSVDMNTFCR